MKTFRLLSVVALALLVCSGGIARGQAHHDNVVIVLDASGSMRSKMPGASMSKMDAAKGALKAILQKLPPSTQVGLLVFSAAGLKPENEWVCPLGPRDDATLLPAIDRLEGGNGTPLGAYLKRAADRLLEERAKQFGYGSYRMLVLTDGEAQDQNLVDRYTPEIMARGITLDVIGVAMSRDHTLATKAHSYRRANDPESLNRALREVFAEVAASGTDLTRSEAFDALAPLPAETVSAMIQALCASGNHPIGTQSASSKPASPRPTAAVPPTTAPKAAAPPTTAPRPANRATPPIPIRHHSSSPGFRLNFVVMIAGGVVILLFLKKIFQGTRQ